MVKRSRSDSPTSDAPDSSSDVESATAKVVHLDKNISGKASTTLINCLLPPHAALSFSTYDEYDIHYKKSHLHRCVECERNLPTEHFLNLHIAENHDPLNEAKKARGDKIYACFVEDCDKKCRLPVKRRMHLIDKHHFPKDYDFFIVNSGLGKRKSMLRTNMNHQRHGSIADKSVVSRSESIDIALDAVSTTSSKTSEDVSAPQSGSVDDGLEHLSKSMASLKFVPSSVRFGRGRGRGGLARR